MWDLWWTKWPWDVFSPSTSVFLCQFQSIGAPLHGKMKKKTNNNNNNNNNNISLKVAVRL
jgi:hypothetical protein